MSEWTSTSVERGAKPRRKQGGPFGDAPMQRAVFKALRYDVGRSLSDIMEATDLPAKVVTAALQTLKAKRIASFTGSGGWTYWYLVPGATMPEDGRGKSPGSLANLKKGPGVYSEYMKVAKALAKAAKEAPQPPKPPSLTWATVLGIADEEST